MKVVYKINIDDWYAVGLELGLEVHTLEAIKERYAGKNKKEEIRTMLYTWLKQDSAASYRKLMSALDAAHEPVSSDKLKEGTLI